MVVSDEYEAGPSWSTLIPPGISIGHAHPSHPTLPLEGGGMPSPLPLLGGGLGWGWILGDSYRPLTHPPHLRRDPQRRLQAFLDIIVRRRPGRDADPHGALYRTPPLAHCTASGAPKGVECEAAVWPCHTVPPHRLRMISNGAGLGPPFEVQPELPRFCGRMSPTFHSRSAPRHRRDPRPHRATFGD